ncbi:hypothetical protein [Glutamicibacter protophormiae]
MGNTINNSRLNHKTSLGLMYALAENVELRQNGWQDEAIKRAVLCALHESIEGLTKEAVAKKVEQLIGSNFKDSELNLIMLGLGQSSSLVIRQDKYYLSESSRTKLDEELSEAKRIEESCKSRLMDIARKHGLVDIVSWNLLLNSLIIPMTNELGSRTFQLLQGQTPVHDTVAGRNFVDSFPPDEHQKVREIVTEYIDPSISDVRKHILGYLTNYTIIAARGLSGAQMNNLIHLSEDLRFDVLLDTNVIFSILGLHKNPLNEAANDLLSLKEVLKGSIDIRFYVLDSTVNEAKMALTGAYNIAKKVEKTPDPFAAAALENNYVSGLVGGFLEKRLKFGSGLTASSHFTTYIYSLETYLTAKNIDTVDDSETRDLPETQRRANNWMSFQKKDGTKSRGAYLHDATAVETVRKKRGPIVNSAATARWWFVSLDLALQSLERKDLGGTHRLRTTITPDELTQLMRFWVPRSTQMDEALIGAIRMPFAFYSYDAGIEKQTEKILALVSSLQDSSDLSTEDAVLILQDKHLRESLADKEKANDDEALLGAFDRLEFKYKKEAQKLQRNIDELKSQVSSNSDSVAGRSPGVPKKTAKLQSDLQRSREESRKSEEARISAENMVAELEEKLREAEGAEEVSKLDSKRFQSLAALRANRRIIRFRFIAALFILLFIALFIFSVIMEWGRISNVITGVSTILPLFALIALFKTSDSGLLHERMAKKIQKKLLRDELNAATRKDSNTKIR